MLGVVALAVAMGIGRFAFTPLLPLMLRDGTLDAAAGAEWAAANYAGYLVGALTAARVFPGEPRRGLALALIGVALATLAIAALPAQGAGLAGAVLRFAAGVLSAWTLVHTSSWCLAELAHRQVPQLGAWIYTGVGTGIALAGALAWLGGRQSARALWLELGALAAAGAWFVVARLRRANAASTQGASAGARGGGAVVSPATKPAPAPASPPAESAAARPAAATASPVASPPPAAGAPSTLGLVLCYGTFGFGYIVPATFLPAMAREQVSDPLVFGLTWPLFGLAAALSVAAAAKWLARWPRGRVWALAQAVMAAGTALALATQALWALATCAVLVGGTFMVATMAGLQRARELVPANPTPLLARMTVAFAAGQIAGPVLVRAIGAARPAGLDAFAWANVAATVLLAGSAAWLWVESRTAAFSPAANRGA
ncbi:MAG: YbfB/YjiJ family MFS transporter [Burkholderiaceae bacterium]